jgi:GNAT superfamily N-acetyltransferase
VTLPGDQPPIDRPVRLQKHHLVDSFESGADDLDIWLKKYGWVNMAVHRADQGAKLGRSLLIDALRRVVRTSEDVGIRALLIHARDDEARRWYQHQARSIQSSPSDPLHLFLSIKELRRAASER